MTIVTEEMLAYALNYLLSGIEYDDENKAIQTEKDLAKDFKREFGYDIEHLMTYR